MSAPTSSSNINPMQQALSQLHDIQTPETISQFPPAIGWWILMALVLSFIAITVWLYQRHQTKHRQQKLALAELNRIAISSDTALQQINALLKRACLAYFPRENIAHLHGASWQQFLDSQARSYKGKPLTFNSEWLTLQYQPQQSNAQKAPASAFKQYAEQWIKTALPPSSTVMKAQKQEVVNV
ncbi:DUF4381 domain-containing protein [Flocculibacter collagenilyticus]|uniref:DUF4381 domain-containing protein n=1 Tax=Flocculibacter collagenilyticus TaxID=2744479 RepID=UPI0018F50459|nr:DUF4381 domain-containing protein [Flocculibacter collagenilyticus]